MLEIVTEPDIRSADEAYAFLTKLRSYCAIWASRRPTWKKGPCAASQTSPCGRRQSTDLGTQTEIKNLNSFRAVELPSPTRSSARPRYWTSAGQVVAGDRWAGMRGARPPFSQRSKEGAEDYRYFPEPDLPPLLVNQAWLKALRARLPELPDARQDTLYGRL